MVTSRMSPLFSSTHKAFIMPVLSLLSLKFDRSYEGGQFRTQV